MTDPETKRVHLYFDDKMVPISCPENQVEQWDKLADEMGASRSEFVRMMTQAGIRNMHLAPDNSSQSESHTPGIALEDVKNEVRATVQDDPKEFDELVDEATGELEEMLSRAVNDLQDTGELSYRAGEGLTTND